jgi:hypothetical protein
MIRRVSTPRLMQAIPAPISVFRLRFIDMARAVAILCMLEGHFVDLTLAPEWRVRGQPVYEVWHYIRGMTAPMFFTVTGLIFAYLLSGAREPGFFRVTRVRRGLLRAGELLFWGYMLQVDLRRLPDMLGGERDSWLQAFHVLQCIAVGLCGMIVIFGLVRRAGARALAAAYVLSGLMAFIASVWLANLPGPIPQGAPVLLQNAIKGPIPGFPIVPWVGFTFYGAAIGVLVRSHTERLSQGMSPTPLLIAGGILKLAGWALDRFLGNTLLSVLGHPADGRILPDSFHGRLSEILIVLGVLVWIENRFRPGASWFQTIGRNTFPIYVSHVVILYGGIFGIGLKNWFQHSLNPWQAALGAVLFCGFFGFCAQWVEPLMLRWRDLRYRLRGRD